MKWCYIAAPYTVPDPVENTNRVIRFAEKVLKKGYFPVIPHLTLLWQAVNPKPPEFWYNYTMELMKRCDMVIRLSGFSEGADREVALANKLGIEVVYVKPPKKPEDNLPDKVKW
jgi:hypothetical protein